MKHLFQVLPPDFFKPLTSKYKWEYTDCILLIFHSFKPEISYGVNREIVVKCLEGYFESDDEEMSFDEQNIVRINRLSIFYQQTVLYRLAIEHHAVGQPEIPRIHRHR